MSVYNPVVNVIPWKEVYIYGEQRHYNSLAAYFSWIQIARHFEFDPRTLTVTDNWASIFPGKTSLYSAPSCLIIFFFFSEPWWPWPSIQSSKMAFRQVQGQDETTCRKDGRFYFDDVEVLCEWCQRWSNAVSCPIMIHRISVITLCIAKLCGWL